jgi:hypothetical protein
MQRIKQCTTVHPAVVVTKVIRLHFTHVHDVSAVVRTMRLKFRISFALKTFIIKLEVLHIEELHNMAVLVV